MRRRAKADGNAALLDDVARRLGALVIPLDGVGRGFPDRLYVHRGHIRLVEYKNRKGRNRATPDQETFAAQLEPHGVTVHVLREPDDVIALVAGRR